MRTPLSRSAIGAVVGFVLATRAIAAQPEQPPAPPFHQVQSPTWPLPLELPSGFTVEEVANGLTSPRFMALDRDGSLVVAEHTEGKVIRLRDTRGLRVGLTWSGNPKHCNDHHRSIALSELITHLPRGPHYVSLQKQVRPAEEAALASRADIQHFGDVLEDFADTAGLIETLDLVLTVDTAVAHLAGAMGKPVWILLCYTPDWRWLLKRSDSPWYPSARLFRQERFRSWRGVLESVRIPLARRKSAELAGENANIGVIDVPIMDISGVVTGLSFAHGAGHDAEGIQVVGAVQLESISV